MNLWRMIMTGFSINKLAVKNFKHISTNSPLEFDFEDNYALILDGPNGYGKTRPSEQAWRLS